MQNLHIQLEHRSYDCETCGWYVDTYCTISVDNQIIHQEVDDGHFGGSRGATDISSACITALQLLGCKIVEVSEVVYNTAFDPLGSVRLHAPEDELVLETPPAVLYVLKDVTLYMYSAETVIEGKYHDIKEAWVLEYQGNLQIIEESNLRVVDEDDSSELNHFMENLFKIILPNVKVTTDTIHESEERWDYDDEDRLDYDDEDRLDYDDEDRLDYDDEDRLDYDDEEMEEDDS